MYIWATGVFTYCIVNNGNHELMGRKTIHLVVGWNAGWYRNEGFEWHTCVFLRLRLDNNLLLLLLIQIDICVIFFVLPLLLNFLLLLPEPPPNVTIVCKYFWLSQKPFQVHLTAFLVILERRETNKWGNIRECRWEHTLWFVQIQSPNNYNNTVFNFHV